MTTDLASLLALDAYTSEEVLRVAAYDRALQLTKLVVRPSPVDAVATRIVGFVRGECWRMSVVDVALKYADRHTSIDALIEKAEEIAAWAKPPVAPTPAVEPKHTESQRTETQPAPRKKSQRKRGHR